MKASWLNLSFLRRQLKSRGTPASQNDGKAHDLFSGAGISRRRWLGVAGSTAVVASPGLKTIGSLLVGPYELVEETSRVRFRLQGKDRWVVDPRQFAGNPRLSVERRNGDVTLRLEGSRFPGTSVPADFECLLHPTMSGSEARFAFLFGGLTGRGPFEPWLLRMAALELSGEADAVVTEFPREGRLKVQGRIEGKFHPSWQLDCAGKNLISLSTVGMTLRADACTMGLPGDGSESLLRRAPARRTLISIPRREEAWAILPGLPQRAGIQIACRDDAFSVCSLESAESSSGAVRHALVAQSRADDSPMFITLPARGRERAVVSGTLSLRQPHYALTFNGNAIEGAVLARFSQNPVWLSGPGAAVEVVDSPDTSPFECRFTEREITSLQCSPRIRRTLFGLPDAIVEPTPVPRESSIDLFASAAPPQVKVSQQSQQTAVPANLFLLNPTVAVLRPEDFLKVNFEFRNLKLQGAIGSQVLVKDGSKPGYIIVRFPPQNITEEAYFEPAKQDGYTIKDVPGKPSDPDKSKDNSSGEEKPKDPPIPARIAGPSRLVFRVEDGAPITYSLKGLLEAISALPLSVSLHASALTKSQKSYLAQLNGAAGARSGRSTASAAAKKLGTYPGSKSAVDAVKASQTDMKSVRSYTLALQSLPEGVKADPRSVKRLETLQNAYDRDVKSHPSRAKDYAASMQAIVDGMAIADPSGMVDMVTNAILASTPPAEPKETETALELPYKLYLSPNALAGWKHAIDMAVWENRIELWHTILGVRGGKTVFLDAMDQLRTVRAVWSPDYTKNPGSGPGHADKSPFRMSLDRQDRHELVHLNVGFATPGLEEPLPEKVELLMLTSLGAWVNMVGDWKPPVPLSVEHWRHRATVGRDQFVRVVYAGFLYPFGHKASLIKITERKIQKNSKGEPVAYLRQRMYIIVKEREKVYPATGQKNNGRSGPFRRIRVTTVMTPNLDNPSLAHLNIKDQSAFWPFVGGQQFNFSMVGEDWEGRTADFSSAVIFVDQGVAFNTTDLSAVKQSYKKYPDRRISTLDGQRIAYAEPTFPGDTSFPTETITFTDEQFSGDMTSLKEAIKPPFYPAMETAAVHITAAEQLAGSTEPQTIAYHSGYVTEGFNPSKNRGEAFAEVKSGAGLDFDSDSKKAGGLVTPSMKITGLSRSMGAVAGTLDSIFAGSFDPIEFFKESLSKAKFLGGIPLFTLIGKVADISKELDRVPKMTTESSAEALHTKLVWNPKLQKSAATAEDDANYGGEFSQYTDVFEPHDPNGMTITVDVRAPLTGAAPEFTVTTSVTNFSLNLLGSGSLKFIVLKFKKTVFTVVPGHKPDVDVDIDDLSFAGPLEFVNQLMTVVDKGGFSDPPFLDITASGIKAGYTLEIPTVAVGAMSLQNMSLGAMLEIPFTGKPLNVTFSFCTRENPFTLTVSLYGGGGFFAVTVGASGLMKLEASLEFGASVALNLGVAKGGVVVMGGFYYFKEGKTSGYEAYIRSSGALCILGIITISVDFYVGLQYTSNGKMFGTVTVKVKIEIAFFSKTVSMSMTKQFKGSAGDPLFAQTMSLAEYQLYLGAYAAE